MKLWPTLSEEKQTILTRQEENAIMNQLILFVQRIINLRVPVEFTEGALYTVFTIIATEVYIHSEYSLHTLRYEGIVVWFKDRLVNTQKLGH